jgi:hypothetical protein
MNKIKLPDVTIEELDAIVYGLGTGYTKKLRRAQRIAHRTVKVDDELRVHQTVLQEMLAVLNYARKETSDGAGLATPD